jgi:hypothetical protein
MSQEESINNQKLTSVLAAPSITIHRSKHRTPGMDNLTRTQKLTNQIICQTLLKFEEFKNSHRQNINPKSTICIFTSPRGGSTWLGEILLEINNSVLCNEPLFRLEEFSDLNFVWHQPIPPGSHWPDAEEVFRKLLNRELLTYSTYFTNNLMKLPGATHHIFKFCHGNMLLEWLTDHFRINPILLVRHPCAVVSSQLSHHGWEYLKREKNHTYSIPDFRYNEAYYLYEDILKTVKTSEENLAATWCLTMVNSLKSWSNDVKWITVAYENLYVNYEYEIDRIFRRLGLEIPSSIYKMNRKVSVSTLEGSSEYLLSGKQLSSWKDKLTIKQQNNIIGIAKEFGLDHYTLDEIPDLDKMYVQK